MVYPLLKQGYDKLWCPICGKTCFPDAKRANGTIVYTEHDCMAPHAFAPVRHSFEIDVNGDIVE